MAGSQWGEDANEGATGDRDTSIARLALAFVTGVVVTVIATILIAVFSPWLLPVGAVVGAGVAGYLGRVGRVGGTVLGALVMAAVGTATLAGFWLVATADPPRTGGAGLGLVVGFLFVALFVLFGVVLGGLGGLTGAVARHRRATADAPAGDGATAASGRPSRSTEDPGQPEPLDDPDRPDPVDAADGSVRQDGWSFSNVLVGAGLALVTIVIPFAPVAAGFVTGYLEAAGRKRGAVTGAGAGVAATALVVGGLLLFAVLPMNVLRPFIFEYLVEIVVVLGAYLVGLAALGGAFGGSMAS